jgi:hypothetical protein
MALSFLPVAERTDSRLPAPLFRQEVIEYQQIEQQFGRVLLLQPLSTKITTWLMAASVALILSLLFVGQYSRKVSVSGYLLPASGVANLPPSEGDHYENQCHRRRGGSRGSALTHSGHCPTFRKRRRCERSDFEDASQSTG